MPATPRRVGSAENGLPDVPFTPSESDPQEVPPMRRLAAAILLFAAAACGPRSDVPLYTDLGSLNRPVTTSCREAQAYFDQGLRLYYGFNSAEAIRAFEVSSRIDSTCAMCWAGLALAWGPNINIPMDSAGAVH